MQNNLVMTSSPHLRDHSSTQRIMQEVCLALLPAGIAGRYHLRLERADAHLRVCGNLCFCLNLRGKS